MKKSTLTQGGDLIRGLLGSTTVRELRDELDLSMERSRQIGSRVANASNGATASFQSSLDAATAAEEVDLEVEMVKLADEQLRYEAMTQLLQKVYGQIRTAIGS